MMNPKTKQPALSPFLLSKPASEHPFYLGKGTENATQLSRCDSIELNGRIDTRVAQNAQGVVKGVIKGVTRASFGRRAPLTP